MQAHDNNDRKYIINRRSLLKKTAVHILLAIFIYFQANGSEINNRDLRLHRPQSNQIGSILRNEKNTATTHDLISIINRIDHIYGNLYCRLNRGEKLVIFFDPAHGKMPNGNWQGAETNRLSCTGIPEEIYSIAFSRQLYKLLSNNPLIEIQSTQDYLSLLRGEKNTYNNIPFSKTIELAEKAGAFIIISEHLNNVSIMYKASGRVNLPGIHITRSKSGKKILKYVNGTYTGFLTLYNKLDTSGFSRDHALKIKSRLTELSYHPNNWEFGAVADSRFSYFVDYPISVIYENGFISNPEEEKRMKDPRHIKRITVAQYRALLDSIRDCFGVDISSGEAEKVSSNNNTSVDLLKMSRIAVYYIKTSQTSKAKHVIDLMSSVQVTEFENEIIRHYETISSHLTKAELYYSKALRYKKNRKCKKSLRLIKRAINTLDNNPLFTAYIEKYQSFLPKKKEQRYEDNISRSPLNCYRPVRAPLNRTIILAIEQGQSLEDALGKGLAPSPEQMKKLIENFRNAKNVKWKRIKIYSNKRKRYISRWVKKIKKINFKSGIYLVKLTPSLKVKSAKRVGSVILDYRRYQNQQYLKNSYFAESTKHKSI